jgi:hypothetical protein
MHGAVRTPNRGYLAAVGEQYLLILELCCARLLVGIR